MESAKFSTAITKLSNAEMDEMLAKASFEPLKTIFPEAVDLKGNPDLIGFVSNICNPSWANANGDCITNEDGLRIAKHFVYKPVDANHKILKIVGCLVNFGFSKFRSNEILTPEQVSALKEPYNIAVAGILYKNVLNDDFVSLLEQTVDENDPAFGSVKTSWEIFFSSYEVAVGPSRNLFQARILTDKAEISAYEPYLQKNKGKGRKGDEYVFRVLKGNLLLPTAIGLVENAAAFGTELLPVNSETVSGDKPEIQVGKEPEKEAEKEQIEVTSAGKSNEDPNLSVTNPEDTKLMPLKITKLEDLTNENLKLAVADDITAFINEEIKKANDSWKTQLEAKENLRKDFEAKAAAAQTELETTKKTLKEFQDKLSTLEQAEAQRAATEKYNQRLAAIDQDYEISSDERKVVAKNIQGLNDDQFKSYFDDLKILFAAKSKNAKDKGKEKPGDKMDDKEPDDDEDDSAKGKKGGKAKASTEEVEDAVDKGVAKAEKEATVPNATEGNPAPYKARFAAAFKFGEGIELVRGKKTVKFE